jgi:endonuclease YncB( thermonuclease family)
MATFMNSMSSILNPKSSMTLSIENATSDVPLFTLKGLNTKGKIVKVYDGDTVHCVFPFMGQLFKWHVRIAHVDTPELKTKNLQEKERGYITRDKLIEFIGDKVVDVNCLDFDKYGRVLAELTYNGVRVDEWLIQNGYAHKYEGNTKEKW